MVTSLYSQLFVILILSAEAEFFLTTVVSIAVFIGIVLLLIVPKSRRKQVGNDENDVYIEIDENDHAHISTVPKGLPHSGMKISRERLLEMVRSGKLEVTREEWEAATEGGHDKN